jgi:hypothetical protein
MTIDGDVVEVHSRWTGDHSRIVTEATVRTPTGDVVVSQLGGSVDGIAQRQFPGPEPLVAGMKVSVAAHQDADLSSRMHVVVDATKVIAYPPGFVRTGPTKSGHYLKWESGCVLVNVAAEGTAEIAGDGEFAVIDDSIDTWNNDTASCSYLQVMNLGKITSEVGNDKVNLIKFRDTTWGRPAIGDDAARSYAAAAAGITTATYIDDAKSDRDGAILDADVELNGVNFAISVDGQTLGTEGCLSDLQNTLTHELGHLHGLEHPCRVGNDPARVDGDNNPVPLCNDVLASPNAPANKKIIDATMYNFQTCGETSKSTLSQDDIDAICRIYPTAQDPKTCDPVTSSKSGGCCSAGSDRPDVSFLLAGTVGMILLGRRRAKNSRNR